MICTKPPGNATMDVGDWLRSVGLGQYETTFRDSEIDAEVLPELTDADLEKLGVPLGHRKRLLKAITALNMRAAGSTPPLTVVSGPKADAAERRQLTVMFCDLVGSTAISARLDPEDMRGVIASYHNCCASLIERNGGFVAKYMGDGVLAYFGYPQAHEHDAENGVRAGLAIVEAAPRLESAAAAPLHVRAGIATGIVVVGDLLGSGEAQERGVVGDTPNLAARLQGIAEPNSVVIAEGTRRLLGDLFELKDLGPQDLKGVARPTHAYTALRESSHESRFEALHTGGLGALVGREEETELLMRRWAKAKAGQGQVALLSGEAGIGKSRLAATILERLAGEPNTRLRYFCSPQHTDSALYPIIGQMERAAGLSHEDDAKTKLYKLEALLAMSSTSPENMALLADMLSLPDDGRYPMPDFTPQVRRQKTQEAVISQVEALARKNPVLMILEDAHWSDPTSLEVFGRLVDRIQTLRVLLIVTFRPEFEPPWIGRPHVTALTLNRLARQEIEALIDRVVGNKPLPTNVREDIVERTDGIPLFVEEMTKAVLEAEGEVAAVRAVAAVPSPALAVPASLHASLMARLDRLGNAKGVAQVAAAIGREFSHALLAAVLRKPEAELASALDRLARAGLLFRQGVPPHATYVFKHALVQDAAYGTLLRSRRQELHAQLAAALETQFPELVAAQPELLAHHSTEAGLTAQAVDNWRRAGELAIERSANLEAINHLSRGLQILKTLPESRQRHEQELVFQVALLAPHWASKGFASPAAGQVAARAEELCQLVGGKLSEHIRALWGLAVFHMCCGELQIGFAAGERCLQLAEQLQDRSLLGHAQFLMGNLLFWFAELVRARAHLEQGIALYDPERARFEAARFGFQDHSAACYSFLGRLLWHLGYPEQAKVVAERSISNANDLGHPFSVANALSWAAALHQLCGDVGRTRELSETDLVFSTEQVIPFFAAHAMVLRGWTLVMQGRGEEGVVQLGAGLAAYRATGSVSELPHWLGLMAEACCSTSRIEEGLHVVAEALEISERTGIVYYEAELHRLEGELRLNLEPPDAPVAEMCFRRAMDIAGKQQAKSWELRTATSYARLMCKQGRVREAHDLLAPIYGWFTEGFDTLDLKEAKALLKELA
jgi:class 3 adenylate cyclase/predicted ATPase